MDSDRGRGLITIRLRLNVRSRERNSPTTAALPNGRGKHGAVGLIRSPREAAASGTKAKQGGVCRWCAGSLTVCPNVGFPRSA